MQKNLKKTGKSEKRLYSKNTFFALCYMVIVINTYNESTLHKMLKELYALETGGKTEEKIDGKICDVFAAEKNEIIEIQTGTLARLRNKISVLTEKYAVRLVYPLVTQKTIITYDKAGNTVSKRKSPKKQTIYSMFRELTALYPWLLHKNFTLEVVFVHITEIRRKTEKPVQAANKRRRFLRNWIKSDKILNSIEKKIVFAQKDDYLKLLPPPLLLPTSEGFSVNDICKTSAEKIKKDEASCMVWVLNKAEIIEVTKKIGRARYYQAAK
ncbi:MAG: hypothetical protein Ta2A_07320 [Treponemataceae bacterium]|nr:MAG: hypothetical protein Ta2A_07320 [Treponemataceae bacterium]